MDPFLILPLLMFGAAVLAMLTFAARFVQILVAARRANADPNAGPLESAQPILDAAHELGLGEEGGQNLADYLGKTLGPLGTLQVRLDACGEDAPLGCSLFLTQATHGKQLLFVLSELQPRFLTPGLEHPTHRVPHQVRVCLALRREGCARLGALFGALESGGTTARSGPITLDERRIEPLPGSSWAGRETVTASFDQEGELTLAFARTRDSGVPELDRKIMVGSSGRNLLLTALALVAEPTG